MKANGISQRQSPHSCVIPYGNGFPQRTHFLGKNKESTDPASHTISEPFNMAANVAIFPNTQVPESQFLHKNVTVCC